MTTLALIYVWVVAVHVVSARVFLRDRYARSVGYAVAISSVVGILVGVALALWVLIAGA